MQFYKYKQFLLAHMMYVGENNDRLAPRIPAGNSSRNSGYPAGGFTNPGKRFLQEQIISVQNLTSLPDTGAWKLYMCPLDRTNTHIPGSTFNLAVM